MVLKTLEKKSISIKYSKTKHVWAPSQLASPSIMWSDSNK